jgi:hypothetical protein
MSKREQLYRPLNGSRWFYHGPVRSWKAAGHLLLVENRFFSEDYTRLFWADIETVLLYRLHSRSSLLLGFEIVCVLAVAAPILFWIRGWTLALGLLFILIYGIWRLARPQWACEVATRTSVKQFAIPGTAASSRRVVDEIKNSVIHVQGALPETGPDSPAFPSPPPAPTSSRPLPRQPVLAVHVIAFVLGILSPFSVFLFAVYCGMLVAAWFAQRDFRFPFAVRSAAIMSQIFAFLRIAAWILVHSGIRSDLTPVVFNHWQFGLPQVLFSLYGIAALYWRSIELARPRQKTGATVLGLS